jgi:two-component system, LytTR family, sensor kinase
MIQAVRDWQEIARYQLDDGFSIEPSAKGSDWVVWEEMDDGITASYVFPNGPGDRGGLQQGDRFYMLEYQQFFDSEDLKNALAGIKPGLTRRYDVVRDGELVNVDVTFERHPTFLYPRSPGVWQFAIWGFTIGAFFHLLGLFIAGPLAIHSARARFEVVVIAVSALWIMGNLVRLLSVELFGPAPAGSTYDSVFQAFTFIGLVGWIGFPVLLVRKVSADAGLGVGLMGVLLRFTFVAPFILVVSVVLTTLTGHIGPFTMEELLVPILFYAAVYIGMAALVSFGLSLVDSSKSGRSTIQWGKTDSLIIFSFSLVAALAVLDIIPVLSGISDQTAAWLIVSAQLLAVLPVSLYSVGTLRYGKVDEVLSGAFVYVLVIGLIFFAFIGGLTLIDAFIQPSGKARIVLEGVFVVILLVVFERTARRLRLFASSFFANERFKGRQIISQLQEEIPDIFDESALAQKAIDVAGQVFGARSAIIFVKSPADGSWLVKRYNPEPPYLTEQVFQNIWQHFEFTPTIWARNPELNQHPLPGVGRDQMLEHRAALAIPIKGESASIGLIILGLKSRRRSVYNLEDLDQLRSLAGNLALAFDRLGLVEREKKLAAESTQAHLVALRAQINPHFLFNALNTLLSLIEERPDEAEAVVEHLAAIFRHTLNTSSRAFVKMEEEMSLVEHYLAIERARFGTKLQLSCDLAPDMKHHPVPAFLIQTLVENAIKHGLEKRRAGGKLSITIKSAMSSSGDGSVEAHILIQDSGVGIPALFGMNESTAAALPFFGIGLTNVYQRLSQLFERDDLMHFTSDPETGTTVSVILPLNRTN